MASLHTEVNFEDELVGHLTRLGGWLLGESKGYDRTLGLYTEDAVGWLQDTQAGEYAKTKTSQNGSTDKLLLERLAKTIAEDGPLWTLRNVFKRHNARFRMCAFKPGHNLNVKTIADYEKVRCRVVRQLRYSEHNENCIDVVLFVNGIPIATLELKTDLTQSIEDAVKQYKDDRTPRDLKTGKPEPLLTFNRGALVHFAVSTDEVRMTTRLDGPNTEFLPFNLGHNEGAGNPPNPNGMNTSYLWEGVLQRDSFLEILEKYLHLQTIKDDDGKELGKQIIFPRYHQWDAVRKLTSGAKTEGPGKNYLIQHSAGSGKSNTIMWLAHQLSSLHDSSDKKVFDSIIVVTDRTVLDEQLKDAVLEFEHKGGLVESINDKNGSKSGKLFLALQKKTAIIIVTIQTFPHAVKAIGELQDMDKRSFAIIADEAHSSQTGQAAKTLREALGVVDLGGDDTSEISAEDVLLATAAKRAGSKNISYFAFTATPKPKTMERFGRIPLGESVPKPFHVYTMQQAIEEGFILDVLQNYTTYEVAYKLATIDDKTGERVVPKSDAAKLIAKAAKLHPHAIEQKVGIIVEHFRESVQPLLGGRAKAMVVCDGRKGAVRYKLAIDKYIKEKGYSIATLVAFSGKVVDDVRGIEETFTETEMNGLEKTTIPKAFKTDQYQVLLVAEKYQTGFNQPLLVAMYVDKKLANIAAVQTLSRLNRTYRSGKIKKVDTFVLDFVNEADDILSAFMPYYRTATITGITDPDLIHDLQKKLDKTNMYTTEEVEAYFLAWVKAQQLERGEKRQSLLMGVLNPIVDRFNTRLKTAIEDANEVEKRQTELFREDLTNFVRLYGFLSQIYDYSDSDLEKRYLMFTFLVRLLKDSQDQAPVDISGVDMTHFKAQVVHEGDIGLKGGKELALKPPGATGTAKPHDKEYVKLQEIISAMNEVFGDDFADEHKVKFFVTVKNIAMADDVLKERVLNNSFEQVMSAGETKELGERVIVEAKEKVIEDNHRHNAALDEGLEKLLSDEEALSKVIYTVLKAVYKQHHDEAA